MKRNLLIITLLFLGSFVILLLGNIIIIGEKIASLSQVAWAEYAFYTLILVVFYAVVIRPVVRVHRAPQIPALSIDGEWNIAQLVAFGHKLADNCNYIPGLGGRGHVQKNHISRHRVQPQLHRLGDEGVHGVREARGGKRLGGLGE